MYQRPYNVSDAGSSFSLSSLPPCPKGSHEIPGWPLPTSVDAAGGACSFFWVWVFWSYGIPEANGICPRSTGFLLNQLLTVIYCGCLAALSVARLNMGCKHPVRACRAGGHGLAPMGTHVELEAMLDERGKWHCFRMSFIIKLVIITLL